MPHSAPKRRRLESVNEPRPDDRPGYTSRLNTATLCAYIGRSPSWLAENRMQLDAEGFPRPDPLLGGYDRCAVDTWLDRRSHLTETTLKAAPAPAWDKPVR